MKDFMQMYSGLVERCFNDCAHDMSSAKLKWVVLQVKGDAVGQARMD
jgi:hypothetical protein